MAMIAKLTDMVMKNERRRDLVLISTSNDIYRSLLVGRHELALTLLSRLDEVDKPIVVAGVVEELRHASHQNSGAVNLAETLLYFAEYLQKLPHWERELQDPRTSDYQRYCLQQEMAGLTPLDVHDWRRLSYSSDDDDADPHDDR